jgi:hypothetical protein
MRSRKNSTLQEIDLRGDNFRKRVSTFGSEGAKWIAEAIKENSTLKVLYIGRN